MRTSDLGGLVIPNCHDTISNEVLEARKILLGAAGEDVCRWDDAIGTKALVDD